MRISRVGTLGRTLALLLGIFLLGSTAARAAVIPLSFEQLMAVSDEVVTVRVAEDKSEIASMGRITTSSTMYVVDNFKGKMAPGKKMTMTYLGGRVGNMVMEVPGIPRLKEGEEAVLFLARPLNQMPKALKDNYNTESPLVGGLQVVGGFQGKINILNETADGKTVRKSDESIPFNARVARVQMKSSAKLFKSDMTYGQFRSSLAELAEKQKTKQAQKGRPDRIKGLRGNYAVPERSDDPVIRAFDPLPSMAYMSDEELDALKKQVRSQQAARQAESENQEKGTEKSADESK